MSDRYLDLRNALAGCLDRLYAGGPDNEREALAILTTIAGLIRELETEADPDRSPCHWCAGTGRVGPCTHSTYYTINATHGWHRCTSLQGCGYQFTDTHRPAVAWNPPGTRRPARPRRREPAIHFAARSTPDDLIHMGPALCGAGTHGRFGTAREQTVIGIWDRVDCRRCQRILAAENAAEARDAAQEAAGDTHCGYCRDAVHHVNAKGLCVRCAAVEGL